MYNNFKNNTREYSNRIYKRGDIFLVDLGETVGSEQGGIRPVIIMQNDIGNKYSPTVIVATITSKQTKAKLPTHVELKACECALDRDSVVLLEQIKTLDKSRIINYIGRLNRKQMSKIERAFEISTGLYNEHKQEIKNILAQIKTKDIGITYCLQNGIPVTKLQKDINKLNKLQEELEVKKNIYRLDGYYEIQYEKYLKGEKVSFDRLVG